MSIELSPTEARVIGVLLEKETTTPEVYPMTLNGITTGCNQKSNREPVMSLTSNEVQTALDTLQQKKIVMKMTGQRSIKYMQRLCNTEFSTFQFTPQERAIICLLLLRGPQTPGELRTRSARLAEFEHVGEVETTLHDLSSVDKSSLVFMLDREPGRRENRYMTTLTAHNDLYAATPMPSASSQTLTSNSTTAEQVPDSELQALKAQIESLEKRVSDLEQAQRA